MDKRHDDDTRERIQGYLDRSGLAGRSPRIVPLTPDASDRRYFRILLPGASSIVLSLSAPFDVTRLPFVNVATLMAKMPVPIPEVLGHADDLGVLALQDLGDVTLQAHLGAATPEEHAAYIGKRCADCDAAAARRAAQSADYCPTGSPSTSKNHVGARFLHETFSRSVPRRDVERRPAGGAAAGNSRSSCASSRRSRPCCATATTTAAT